MENREILWDKPAVIYLRNAIKYISKDSQQNALKVKNDILTKISELANRPDIHPPDKYRIYQKGDYRAFELHHFRIAYLVSTERIIIYRIRHTSQEPEVY